MSVADDLRDIADRFEEERPIVDDLILSMRQLLNAVPWELDQCYDLNRRDESPKYTRFFQLCRQAQGVMKQMDAFIERQTEE